MLNGFVDAVQEKVWGGDTESCSNMTVWRPAYSLHYTVFGNGLYYTAERTKQREFLSANVM